MAGDDRSVEEIVKSAVKVNQRIDALERRALDVEGRVTMVAEQDGGRLDDIAERLDDLTERIERLEAGFGALVQRAHLLGWQSFLRDLKAAGFEVEEKGAAAPRG